METDITHRRATKIDSKFFDHEIELLEKLLAKYPDGREHQIILDLIIDAFNFKMRGEKHA